MPGSRSVTKLIEITVFSSGDVLFTILPSLSRWSLLVFKLVDHVVETVFLLRIVFILNYLLSHDAVLSSSSRVGRIRLVTPNLGGKALGVGCVQAVPK